jgi:tRNA(Ile)-lysidine synthase
MGTRLKFDPAGRLIDLAGPKPRVAIAFSGGVDSTALAFALLKNRRRFTRVRLLHVDHGLQKQSAQWSAHCASLAREWQLPFVALRANIQRKRGASPEALARAARYTLLAGPGDGTRRGPRDRPASR